MGGRFVDLKQISELEGVGIMHIIAVVIIIVRRFHWN
jgi:hypothetical protein